MLLHNTINFEIFQLLFKTIICFFLTSMLGIPEKYFRHNIGTKLSQTGTALRASDIKNSGHSWILVQ